MHNNLIYPQVYSIIAGVMEQEIIDQNKEDFLNILTSNVNREGLDKFIEWLCSTDFFVAPASSRFHLKEPGGLCQHSLNVYNRFVQLMTAEYGEDNFNLESVTLCALLHDICKANFYKVEMRNVKEDGVWVQKPYYAVDEILPYGHGEKSVYIINGFIRLTREEAIAINWHMGDSDARAQGGASYTVAAAYRKYPFAALMHMADFMATYLDESEIDE